MAGSPLYGLEPDRRASMRDKLAQQMLMAGVDTSPIQSPWQGVARLAQALMGGQMMRRGEEETAKRETDYASGLNAALMGEGGAGDIATRLGASGNPDLARLATQFRIKDIDGRLAEARDKAKAAEEAKLPKNRYHNVGNSMFDFQGADPTKPVWTAPDKPNGIIAEYNFAKGQGFPGSFMAYQIARQRPPAGSQEERDDAILFNPNANLDSPEYRAAHFRRSLPRPTMVPDEKGVMTMSAVSPSLPSHIRPPGNMQPPTEALQQLGGPPPDSAPAPEVIPQDPGMPPNASGLNVRPIAPPAVDKAAKAKMDTAIGEAATLSNALDDYVKAFEGASVGERATSVLGVNTASNTAYSNAALLAKGDVLYQLGVLNGPDLTILQKTLADPSTFKGQAAGPEAARAAAETVRRLIQDRITAARQQQGLPPLNIAEYGRGLRRAGAGGNGGAPPPPPGFFIMAP